VALIVIGVIVLLALAAVMLLGTARRRAGTGKLGRDTRRSDASAPAPGATPAVADASDSGTDAEDLDGADESRRSIGSGSSVPVTAGARSPVRYEPVDEDELGVTRRQFFNRGILTGLSLAVAGFGGAALAFLWPTGAGGTSGKITVGSVDDVDKKIATKEPFYNATAQVYIVAFPKQDLKKAEKVYPSTITAGMAQGYVALFQKCPHLGCRVPWCQTSQWFECPCHGSKYNRVGEKRGGPAPRGMDSFPLAVEGGSIIVDKSAGAIQGPPIGTDTTGQGQEGAPCV
jgi:cytochrome b6-f complex iron-sulfur subunit